MNNNFPSQQKYTIQVFLVINYRFSRTPRYIDLFPFPWAFRVLKMLLFFNLHHCRRNTLQTKELFFPTTFPLDKDHYMILIHIGYINAISPSLSSCFSEEHEKEVIPPILYFSRFQSPHVFISLEGEKERRKRDGGQTWVHSSMTLVLYISKTKQEQDEGNKLHVHIPACLD